MNNMTIHPIHTGRQDTVDRKSAGPVYHQQGVTREGRVILKQLQEAYVCVRVCKREYRGWTDVCVCCVFLRLKGPEEKQAAVEFTSITHQP